MQDGDIRHYTAPLTFGHSILWNTHSNRILTLLQPGLNLLLLVSKAEVPQSVVPYLQGSKQ